MRASDAVGDGAARRLSITVLPYLDAGCAEP